MKNERKKPCVLMVHIPADDRRLIDAAVRTDPSLRLSGFVRAAAVAAAQRVILAHAIQGGRVEAKE